MRNGGSITNDPEGLTIVGGTPSIFGESASTVGTVTVTGSGSTFDAGQELFIGAGFDVDAGGPIFDGPGTGQVTVENGASLSAGQAEGDGDNDIFIGNNGTLKI